MLASPTKTSPFVDGACRSVELRTGPPSRAYLKFWEACTRLGARPEPGDTCIDLGASPGGWTWAMARLGARRWMPSVRRIVCTIKFQGATDHDTAEAFAAIEGACVVHLFHNKHDLTFLWERRS